MSGIPQRVQMTRRYPWRSDHPDAVIVDRRTKWGNPFKVGGFYDNGFFGQPRPRDDTHQAWGFTQVHTVLDTDHAVALFDQWLMDKRKRMPESYILYIAGLPGYDLACWCPLWNKATPCPDCCGKGSISGGSQAEPCETCEGTRFTRHPCHADVLLRHANAHITFPWMASNPEVTR